MGQRVEGIVTEPETETEPLAPGDPIGFTHGFVHRRNRIYVAAVSGPLEDENIHHGYMLRYLDGDWGHWSLDIRIAGLWVEELDGGPTVFCLGIDGRVEIAQPGGFSSELVDTGPEAPSELRDLNCIRKIGSRLYTAGMRRQVYVRALASGPWARADQGMLISLGDPEVAGLLAIDGTGPNDIYGVGFGGQIWHWDGRAWTKIDSPTNIKLECVRCLSPTEVLIAGAKGLIFRGYRDQWAVVDQDVTEYTFWGMEPAFGTVFLSTDQGLIYRLDDDELTPVDFGLRREVTTRSLHYNDGLLLSVGIEDVLSFDGRSWTTLAKTTLP